MSKSALGPIGGALLLILVESPFLACTPGMNPEAASDGAVTADSGHGPLRPDRSDDTPQPGGSDGGALPHRGREVGEQGATVTFDGLVLEIPPGALARSEWIDCAPTAAPAPSVHQAFTPVFSCTPDGLLFAKPVVASFTLRSGDPSHAAVYWTEGAGGPFRRLPSKANGQIVSASIAHFSHGFVGHENPCGQYLQTDPDNCGSCGVACPRANGVVGCRAGECELQCHAGWGNCNASHTTKVVDGTSYEVLPASDADGCETELSGNPGHCGKCHIGCDAHAYCGLAKGKDACLCNPGYQGDGLACTDVDECAAETHRCAADATCANTPGGYTCSCKPGFVGDGFSCVEVNECAAGTHKCAADAVCTNSLGGYTCNCKPGLVGDGFACDDVDECAAGTHKCAADAVCTNTAGSYSCACRTGFSGNGFICVDVDECVAGSACGLNALCTNTPGGHTCICQPGFAGDGLSCVDVDECQQPTSLCHPGETCINAVGSFVCQPPQGSGPTDECAAGMHSCDANATCDDLPDGYQCTCKPGLAGNGFICADVDECGTGAHRCDPHAACVNTVGSYACACRPGFSGDGTTCAEVDECALGLHACDARATCVNAAGSYTCLCESGYSGNGFLCGDIDECAASAPVCDPHATCANVAGGYTCACASGYSGNGKTCTDVDECANGDHRCDPDASCTNTVGGYTCACNAGHTGNGKLCTDINECALGLYTCPTLSVCINTPGSYTCDCKSGYAGDGKSGCLDVDECATGKDNCDAHASCTNTIGGFTCACAAGYQGDGVQCSDVDECATAVSPCHAHAACTNAPGSYSCTCEKGYDGDGVAQCADVDECATGRDNCDAHASCTNTVGSFTCACAAGYQGDGAQCADIDECATTAHRCHADADCSNTPGSYSCACKKGYDGDGVTQCADVDECATGAHSCGPNADCTNTAGGFSCACRPGYAGDGKTCVPVGKCALGILSCDPNAGCVDSPGGSSSCVCRAGLDGDGTTCADVDECASEADLCSPRATCKNTFGSYVCSCQPGYQGDGVTCVDIDECALSAKSCGPDATCINTDGGYSCACKRGYAGDGSSCVDINECATGVHNCHVHALCTNTPGSFTCACRSGYQGDGVAACQPLSKCAQGPTLCAERAACTDEPDGSYSCTCDPGYGGDGFVCADLDECVATLPPCGPHATCTNTPGSFTCACGAGYRGDGLTCTEVDECAEGTAGCDPNATCTNTPGGHSCACKAGFEGDGARCTDVDECAAGTHRCSVRASCVNTPGSYTCRCSDGYSGDGFTCTDVDECARIPLPCDPNASCVNTLGGYSCACRPGFSGDGKVCTDVDECGAGSPVCHRDAICTNTPGSYGCACRTGYSGDGVVSCLDIDECALGTSSCSPDATCLNSPGSYSCACKVGYSGDGYVCKLAPPKVVALGAGGAHSCAALDDGGLRCWGWGIYGELGTGNLEDIGDDEPAAAGAVSYGMGVITQVAVGVTHACVLVADGSVRCWGRNHYGTLGYPGRGDVGDDETPASVGEVSVGGMVAQLAAGGEHTCALLSSGSVRCWGLGIDGQLGHGTTATVGDDETPAAAGDVDVGEPVTQVVAGRDHTCALLTTGAVRCWGRGTWGATGHGHTRNVGDDEAPSAAGDLNLGGKAIRLASGWYHTCAVLELGQVRCWGWGGFGQLGYGTTASIGDDEAPASAGDVDLGGKAVQVAAGTFHTCALLEGGQVRCWGRGNVGQLGDRRTCSIGDDELPSSVEAVRLGGAAVEIVAGSFHTCALMASGQVRCWGDGTHGRLGYGKSDTIGDDEIPARAGDVPLSPDTDECAARAASCPAGAVCVNTIPGYTCACDAGYAGDGRSCADVDECASGVDACDANASCTNVVGGYTCACNSGYQGSGLVCAKGDPCAHAPSCGPHATCTPAATGYLCTCQLGYYPVGPTCVDLDECATGVAECDVAATCSNTEGGYSCSCEPGFFGDGKTCQPNYVQAVTAGGTHTCALLGSGAVRCWGLGYSGQLGYGNTVTIGDDEAAASAGDLALGMVPTLLAAGGAHTCALSAQGRVRCWGQGASGQLGYARTSNVGDDETAGASGDVEVGGVVTSLSAGGDHSCALLVGGRVRCWGLGLNGRLGYADIRNIGDDETPASAGDVNVGGKVIQLSSGKEHTCALLEGGFVRCWGSGKHGRLGYAHATDVGDDETPASMGDVNVGAKVVQVAAGYAHTCAVLESGGLRCWGQGLTGQLGYANTANIGDDEVPAVAGDVPLGSKVIQVATGIHTCALLDPGDVVCWGSGQYGRLGYGSTLTIGDDETPADAGSVSLGAGATAVTNNVVHTCALLEGGGLSCWGFGANGQLGYGSRQSIGDDESPVSAGLVPVR